MNQHYLSHQFAVKLFWMHPRVTEPEGLVLWMKALLAYSENVDGALRHS